MTLNEWITASEGEKLLITDSVSNVSRLIRRINRTGKAVGLLNVTTPARLARELYLRRCAEEGRNVRLRMADREACVGLVEGILRDAPDRYPFVPRDSLCRATADEVLAVLDLIREGVTTPAFDDPGNGKTQQLRQLVHAYEEALESRGLCDEPALLAAGRNAACEIGRTADGGMPAAACFWEEPTALTWAFVRAAVPECALLETETAEPDRIWRFFSGYGIWNEPEYVLEDVLRRGIAFGDVRILYSSPEYEAPLEAAFGMRKVPLRFVAGRPAAGEEPVHRMLSVLDWAENGYRYELLRPVVLDPAFAWPEGSESDGTPAEEFLRGVNDGIGWGLDRYEAFLRAPARSNRRSAAFQAFLRDVTGVFRGLSAPVRPAELFSRLLSFSSVYGGEEGPDALLLSLLRKTGKDLELAAPAEDMQEAIGLVRDVLRGLRIEEPEDGCAVAAGMLTGIEVLDRPYLYVLGLADRHCASSLIESPVLNDAERRLYFDREAGRVPLACERPGERMETYLRSLRGAEAREIHVGYCCFDTVKQEPLSPSSLFMDLREAYGDGPEESTVVEYPGVLRESTVVRAGDLWQDGSEAAGDGPGAEPEEGAVVRRELAFSPSSLDVLLGCPAEYLFRCVRGIPEEEYDVPDENAWLRANERGTFFHRIAEKYVNEKFVGAASVAPDLDPEAFGRIFREAAEETERKVPVAYPAAARREREEMRKTAEGFLRELHREFSGPDCPWRVLACERSFGMNGQEPYSETYRFDVMSEPEEESEEAPVRLRTDEFTVRYRGVIDRLDGYEDADGVMHYRLVDYKTGSRTYFSEKAEKTVQHHIYASCMARTGKVEEFVYCFPFETREEDRKLRITEFADPIRCTDVRTRTFDPEKRRARERMLDARFVENSFPPAPEKVRCGYCRYADICRKNMEIPEEGR